MDRAGGTMTADPALNRQRAARLYRRLVLAEEALPLHGWETSTR